MTMEPIKLIDGRTSVRVEKTTHERACPGSCDGAVLHVSSDSLTTWGLSLPLPLAHIERLMLDLGACGVHRQDADEERLKVRAALSQALGYDTSGLTSTEMAERLAAILKTVKGHQHSDEQRYRMLLEKNSELERKLAEVKELIRRSPAGQDLAGLDLDAAVKRLLDGRERALQALAARP